MKGSKEYFEEMRERELQEKTEQGIINEFKNKEL